VKSEVQTGSLSEILYFTLYSSPFTLSFPPLNPAIAH
jgi:hypothetical protein